MGVPSVGSTSGNERDGEDTDPGEMNLGVTDESIQFRGLTLVLVLWKVRGESEVLAF